jgi:hypothetical protein
MPFARAADLHEAVRIVVRHERASNPLPLAAEGLQ